MKGHEQMNWTKRQTQYYGILMAVLGCIIGALTTKLVIAIIHCY